MQKPLYKTIGKTKFIDTLSSLSDRDTIVCFNPFYTAFFLNTNAQWQNFCDSGFYAHFGTHIVNHFKVIGYYSGTSEKYSKYSKLIYKNILQNRLNYAFSDIEENEFSKIRREFSPLIDSIKSKNSKIFKVPDSLYNHLFKHHGNLFLFTDITFIHEGSPIKPREFTLIRVFVIEKRTRLLSFYDFFLYDPRNKQILTFRDESIPILKRTMRKLKKKLPK